MHILIRLYDDCTFHERDQIAEFMVDGEHPLYLMDVLAGVRPTLTAHRISIGVQVVGEPVCACWTEPGANPECMIHMEYK